MNEPIFIARQDTLEQEILPAHWLAQYKLFGEERGLFKQGGGRTCATFDYGRQRILAVGDEQSCACWAIEGFVTCSAEKVEAV